MKINFIFLFLLLSTTCILERANAGDGPVPPWGEEIISIAQTFSDLAKEQRVIDYSISHLHPFVQARAAGKFGVTAEELPGIMRQGYKAATATIRFHNHDILPEHAIFGTANDWQWGAIPYTVEGIFINNGTSLPVICSWLLVFRNGTDWFFNSLYSGSAETTKKTIASLPYPLSEVAVSLGQPRCAPD